MNARNCYEWNVYAIGRKPKSVTKNTNKSDVGGRSWPPRVCFVLNPACALHRTRSEKVDPLFHSDGMLVFQFNYLYVLRMRRLVNDGNQVSGM